WVALANTQGQGEASVPYTVSPNPVPVSRAAAIVVSDISLQLNQVAAPCRFAFSPSGASVQSAGGPITVQITTLTGWAWTAATDAAERRRGGIVGTVPWRVFPRGHHTSRGKRFDELPQRTVQGSAKRKKRVGHRHGSVRLERRGDAD